MTPERLRALLRVLREEGGSRLHYRTAKVEFCVEAGPAPAPVPETDERPVSPEERAAEARRRIEELQYASAGGADL